MFKEIFKKILVSAVILGQPLAFSMHQRQGVTKKEKADLQQIDEIKEILQAISFIAVDLSDKIYTSETKMAQKKLVKNFYGNLTKVFSALGEADQILYLQALNLKFGQDRVQSLSDYFAQKLIDSNTLIEQQKGLILFLEEDTLSFAIKEKKNDQPKRKNMPHISLFYPKVPGSQDSFDFITKCISVEDVVNIWKCCNNNKKQFLENIIERVRDVIGKLLRCQSFTFKESSVFGEKHVVLRLDNDNFTNSKNEILTARLHISVLNIEPFEDKQFFLNTYLVKKLPCDPLLTIIEDKKKLFQDEIKNLNKLREAFDSEASFNNYVLKLNKFLDNNAGAQGIDQLKGLNNVIAKIKLMSLNNFKNMKKELDLLPIIIELIDKLYSQFQNHTSLLANLQYFLNQFEHKDCILRECYNCFIKLNDKISRNTLINENGLFTEDTWRILNDCILVAFKPLEIKTQNDIEKFQRDKNKFRNTVAKSQLFSNDLNAFWDNILSKLANHVLFDASYEKNTTESITLKRMNVPPLIINTEEKIKVSA